MREVTSVAPEELTNTILYFTAPWCGPCKQLGPIMDDLAEEYGDRLQFRKINVDEADPNFVVDNKVRSVPTIKLFVNGDVAQEWIGLQPKRNFAAKFDEYVGD